MSIGWFIPGAIAYVAIVSLSSILGSSLRRAREQQTRPVQLETVRDSQLDIGPALERRPR